ncbi:hypothetical protein J7K05_02110 [bacterium]|nr:hypothetical protein [bacterium]
MLKNIKKANPVFLFLFVLFVVSFLFFPQQLKAAEKFEVPSGETKTGVQLITQPEAQIEGRIEGDVFILNQTTIISGVIDGNLFFVGKTISLEKNSEIKGSVFIAADTVNLKGIIEGNSYIACSKLYTTSSFKHKGEFNFVATEAELKGAYHQKARAKASQINLKGAALLKGANFRVKYLNYDNKTISQGDLTYYSPYEALGENQKLASSLKWKKLRLPSFWQKFSLYLSQKTLSLLYILIFGFLWIWLWQEKYKTTLVALREKLGPALGWGVLTILILPSVLIILLASVLGIPLALVVIGAFVFWAYLSPVVVGGLLGNYFLQLIGYDGEKYPYLSLFLGVLFLFILYALPEIGWVFRFFTIALALGAVVAGRKEILGLKF